VAALSEDRLRSSIFTGTAAQLRLRADPEVIYFTSVQDHDMALAGKTKAAVFIITPDERQTRDVLATLYVSQAYQALVDEAKRNGGKLPVRVNFVQDEFGNLSPIPAFDKKLTVSAGRGMRFLLAVQDLAQIKARYREASQTVTANCATWVYLATADVETAKVISVKTGPPYVPFIVLTFARAALAAPGGQPQFVQGAIDLLNDATTGFWALSPRPVVQLSGTTLS